MILDFSHERALHTGLPGRMAIVIELEAQVLPLRPSDNSISGPGIYEVFRSGQWISLPVVSMQRSER